MVRKESATKSGKKSGAQSTSDAPIVIPFAINPKYPHFWKMNFLPERGYDMKEAHPSFEATVQALKWEGFVQHRTYYLEQIVREFYAGLMNKAEGVHAQYSLVRVHITDNERNQRKLPPAALSAQMKARRVFKNIEELKEKKKDKKEVEAPVVDDKKQKALIWKIQRRRRKRCRKK